ncbi:MAG: prenyltransferase/squalene oxidase repeat-containing protein [Planctomycetota bacterium]
MPADNPPLLAERALSVTAASVTDQPSSANQPALPSSTEPSDLSRISLGGPISLLASAAIHAIVLLLLSLWLFTLPSTETDLGLTAAMGDAEEVFELDTNELSSAGGDLSADQEVAIDLPLSDNVANSTIVEPSELLLPTTTAPASQSASLTDAMSQPLASRGGGLDGRKASNRRSLALSGGGTAESEAAVERGLAWLAAHQFDDGGWRFDLETCPQCAGACRNWGFRSSTTDATGLALLCFLGAGYTHEAGPYQESVAKGLYYLQQKMLITSMGGDLRDRSVMSELQGNVLLVQKNGDMYSHAIATLALCEAHAMTRDKTLEDVAQKATDFIVNAQHQAGGWRYEPGEPGDLSVTGWQITALKSALHGKLVIPREVWYRAMAFLDSVQDSRGAEYRYKGSEKPQRVMTVVGLFSRMLLGWPRDHRPLRKGVALVASQSPQQNHMYFNYYASQVLRHHGGPGWERWNPRMRDYLVELQDTQGHETGSWYIEEDWSNPGGRLYTTALAILTLEVYYRYMPMYQEDFIGNAP